MDTKKTLGNIITEKGSIFQLLLVAVFIALAMRFISNGLINILGFSDVNLLILGLIILFISCFYFLIKLTRKSKSDFSIKSTIYYNKSLNTILPFPNYHCSTKLNDNFKSAFVESEVLKKTWDQNSLSINSKDEGKEYKISMDLVDQAIEYDLLMMLSNHLYVYFMFKPKFISVLMLQI